MTALIHSLFFVLWTLNCPAFGLGLSSELVEKVRHVKIGALFPLYKTAAGDFARDSSGMYRFAGFKMAVEEINANSTLLPNTEIRYSLQDSKRDEASAFFAALSVAEWGAQLVVGAASSGSSMNAQLVLQKYHIPQISYASTSAALSDKVVYPFFSRTLPSDALQAQGQVAIVKHYNWTTVATFSSTDGYGTAGIDEFHILAESAGIQIVAQARFAKNQRDFSAQLTSVKQSKAYIFVMFCSSSDAVTLLEQAFFMGMTGSGFVWIGSDSTSKPETWESMSVAVSEEDRMGIMKGFLGMLPTVSNSSESQAFFSHWVQQEPSLVDGACSGELDSTGRAIWQRSDVDGERSQGDYDQCAGIEAFEVEQLDAYVPFAYDAMYLAALALHKLIEVEGGGQVHEESGQVEVDGEALLAAVREVHLMGATGHCHLNERGDRVQGVQYRVVNHRGETGVGLTNVGYWEVNKGFFLCDSIEEIGCEEVVWSTADNSIPPSFVEEMVCHAGEGLLKEEGEASEGRCVTCPVGTFSPGGDTLEQAEGCLTCQPGTFAPAPGRAECISCDVRGTQFYQALAGQGDCLECPLNSERRVPSLGQAREECVCKEGYHQPQGLGNGAECKACPKGGVCSGFSSGSNMTFNNSPAIPLSGYWGNPSFPTTFYECRSGGFCQGGFTCAKGWHGRMCVEVNVGYGNINGFLWECPNGYQSVAAVVCTVGISVGVLLIFFFVNGVLCEFESIDVFLKNLRVLAVVSLFPLRWESNLDVIRLVFQFAMFDVDIAQPNCIMPWSYFQSFRLQLILPTFMALVYLMPVGWRAVAMKRSHRVKFESASTGLTWSFILLDQKSEVAPKFNKAISNIISIAQVFYPTILLMLMASFKCSESSDGKSYLDIDPTFECQSEEHLLLQVVSGVLLPLVLLSPVAALGLLLRSLRRNSLFHPALLQRFGVLYKRYRIHYLWWEPLYVLKVSLLVTFQVFLAERPLVQAFLALLLNSLALAGHFHAAPFARSRSNRLEALMILLSSVFIASGNLFHDQTFGEKNQELLSLGLILLLILGMIQTLNIAFHNIHDDLARAASSSLVTKRSKQIVDKLDPPGNIEGIRSKRLRDAILAAKTHRPLPSQMGMEELSDTAHLVKASKKVAQECSISETEAVPEASHVEPITGKQNSASGPFSSLLSTEEDIPSASECSSPVNRHWSALKAKPISEEQPSSPAFSLQQVVATAQSEVVAFSALVATESANTLQGGDLKTWLRSVGEELSIQDLDLVLSVDEWIAPWVADDSHTSMYARTATADFWRNVEKALPDLMEWLSDADQSQVDHLREVFEALRLSGAHSTKGDMPRANYLSLIVEEDRSSVMYWLCHAQEIERRSFFKLMHKILNANGINCNKPGFKGSKTLRKMSTVTELLNAIKASTSIDFNKKVSPKVDENV